MKHQQQTEKADKEPQESKPLNTRQKPIWLMLVIGLLGALLGTISFAQVFSCVGYYVGGWATGFTGQPPLGPVLIGAAFGMSTGATCGVLAGIAWCKGVRSSLLIIIPICIANTAALLGTIEFKLTWPWDSLTLRTACAGLVGGMLCGAILGILLNALLSFRTKNG